MMSGENLTDEDKIGLERIKNEPMCLFDKGGVNNGR